MAIAASAPTLVSFDTLNAIITANINSIHCISNCKPSYININQLNLMCKTLFGHNLAKIESDFFVLN